MYMYNTDEMCLLYYLVCKEVCYTISNLSLNKEYITPNTQLSIFGLVSYNVYGDMKYSCILCNGIE